MADQASGHRGVYPWLPPMAWERCIDSRMQCGMPRVHNGDATPPKRGRGTPAVHQARAARSGPTTPLLASVPGPRRLGPHSASRVGARHERVVTNAGRSLVRPEMRWMRMVWIASARVIAGRMLVRRWSRIDCPAPGRPRRRWRTEHLPYLALLPHRTYRQNGGIASAGGGQLDPTGVPAVLRTSAQNASIRASSIANAGTRHCASSTWSARPWASSC
jgi:hypothetical protein